MSGFLVGWEGRLWKAQEPENKSLEKESRKVHLETIIFRFPVKFWGCSFFLVGEGGKVEVTGVSQKLQVSKGVFCLGRGGSVLCQSEIRKE